MKVHGDLEKVAFHMQVGNFRVAKAELKGIMKNKNSITLTDRQLKDDKALNFLVWEFNKFADKMMASFWQTQGAMPDWRPNEYEFKLLSDEESIRLAERSNWTRTYGMREVSNIEWNMARLSQIK